jgi:hypothetical protein
MGSRYPSLAASWYEGSGALLGFYDYPKVRWSYLPGTDLLERSIRELRPGTKVRGHRLPNPAVVYKHLWLEGEQLEGRWAERWLKGFCGGPGRAGREAGGAICPRTQTFYTQRLTRTFRRCLKVCDTDS